MPLQNRVDPFGEIQAVPQRGLFMGNRGGRIHDSSTKTLLKRRYASRRWIICECVYKDWHREVMGDGYTELFFLDEVTALAAGHRPCAFCRREAFKRYRHCVQVGAGTVQTVDEMDQQLHGERLGDRPLVKSINDLPDGAMVVLDGAPFAIRGHCILPWSFEGYGRAQSIPATLQNCRLLTPVSNITPLRNGYEVKWHPTADQAS